MKIILKLEETEERGTNRKCHEALRIFFKMNQSASQIEKMSAQRPSVWFHVTHIFVCRYHSQCQSFTSAAKMPSGMEKEKKHM